MLGRTEPLCTKGTEGQGRWGAACRELGKEVTWEGWQVNALERNRLENTNIYCEEGKLETPGKVTVFTLGFLDLGVWEG